MNAADNNRRHAARAIAVDDAQRAMSVRPRSVRSLAAFVLDAEHVGAPTGVNLLLVGDRAITRFNREFLGEDCATDVISFPSEAPLRAAPADPISIGDVVISAQRARAYAAAHGLDAGEELARYMVHGILHCLGYDDTTAASRRRMFARQETLLRQWCAVKGNRLCRASALPRSKPR